MQVPKYSIFLILGEGRFQFSTHHSTVTFEWLAHWQTNAVDKVSSWSDDGNWWSKIAEGLLFLPSSVFIDSIRCTCINGVAYLAENTKRHVSNYAANIYFAILKRKLKMKYGLISSENRCSLVSFIRLLAVDKMRHSVKYWHCTTYMYV